MILVDSSVWVDYFNGKATDVIIGTFCLHHRLSLFHDDRDFDPIEKYLKLQVVQI
jgi:predicted nucleic acid-binding protein